jgi:ribosomal protein S4
MWFKNKYKIMRKYDSDFWNFCYTRKRKNKFFCYFKLSLIHKIRKFHKLKFFDLNHPHKLKLAPMVTLKNYLNKRFLKFKRFWRFCRKRKSYARYVFFKITRFKFNRVDVLLGNKTAFQQYKPKLLSRFFRLKIHVKRLLLFYNKLTIRKLRRWSKQSNFSQNGSLNFFLLNLESRLDSILIRLNLGNKFFARQIIIMNAVEVNDININLVNFRIKSNDFLRFKKSFKHFVYRLLRQGVKHKRFLCQPPFYLEVNYRTLSCLIISKLIDPLFVPYPFFFQKDRFVSGLHSVLFGW